MPRQPPSCGEKFRDGRSLTDTVQDLQQGRIMVAELSIRVIQLGRAYFVLVGLHDPKVKREWDAKFTVGKKSRCSLTRKVSRFQKYLPVSDSGITLQRRISAPDRWTGASCQAYLPKSSYSKSQFKKDCGNVRNAFSCLGVPESCNKIQTQ